MKRTLALILSLVLVMLAMGGAIAEEPKTIVYITNQLGDHAVTDKTWSGVQQAAAKYGWNAEVIECGADQTKYEAYFLDVCDRGDVDYLVSGANTGFQENMERCADEYPDMYFIMNDCGRDYQNTRSNMYCTYIKQNEGSFLVGYIAAALSKTGKVGLVNSMEYATKNDFTVGYISGARAYNPDCKVAVSVIGDFTDSAKAKELSLLQIEQGVDVIFQIASGAGQGVYSACAEKNILSIGVDSDQYELLKDEQPELAKTIVTSMIKSFDTILIKEFDMIAAGTMPWGTTATYGINEDGVSYAINENYNALTTEEVRASVAKVTEDVKAGTVKVATYYDMTEEEYQQYKVDVAP